MPNPVQYTTLPRGGHFAFARFDAAIMPDGRRAP
jgi:hypothetical protein